MTRRFKSKGEFVAQMVESNPGWLAVGDALFDADGRKQDVRICRCHQIVCEGWYILMPSSGEKLAQTPEITNDRN